MKDITLDQLCVSYSVKRRTKRLAKGNFFAILNITDETEDLKNVFAHIVSYIMCEKCYKTFYFV